VAQVPSVTLFIDPASYHFERDRLFETNTLWYGGDTALEPYRYLRDWLGERGVRVHTADLLERGQGLSDLNLYVSLGICHRWRKLRGRADVELSGFVAMDCPAVEPRMYAELHDIGSAFRRVYSFSTAKALRPWLRGPVVLLPFHIPQSWDSVHEEIWANEDRPGFLTMINTNKLPRDPRKELYSERLRLIEFLAPSGQFDLYGMGWGGAPYRVGFTRVPRTIQLLQHRARTAWSRRRPSRELAAARAVYRGAVPDKASTLGRYRFALVIENMALERWVTEKIFDCFYTGTVPVYLGAPDVERELPPECFIDMRDFGSYAELLEHLRALSDHEVRAYREAARAFLASDGFRPFSKEAYAQVFGRIVAEDADLPLAAAA
jgi:hypothetical protein